MDNTSSLITGHGILTPHLQLISHFRRAWTDVLDLAEKIREGKTKWEDLDLDDVDIRFKWAGLFHRSKKTPGKFMMRVKVGRKSGSGIWYCICAPDGDR